MRPILFLLLICFHISGNAQSNRISNEQYILKYKDIAIFEMYRSGVPASITLAQGILESQAGNSRLAKEGNNHFGIKCKKSWTGRTIYANDDDTNECFRAYNTAEESFKDHSDFLRTNWRYEHLFKLDKADYKAWSEGLRKAGYATNTNYHNLINGIVEKYQLHKYDLAPMPEGVIPEYDIKNNNLPVIYAQNGETIDDISKKNDISARQIYKYNDLKKGSTLSAGDIIYLKPKRRRGSEPFHIVQKNESMRDISQLYGIKLKHLYKKNMMTEGEEAAEGSVLYLQKKNQKKPDIVNSELEQQKKNEEIKHQRMQDSLRKIKEQETKNQNNNNTNTSAKNPDFHIIKSGDNLYKLSEMYHVFVEDLLKWNAISSPTDLKVGQKLYLNAEAAKQYIKENIEPKKDRTTKTYTVSKGDTGYSICRKFGISITELKNWNADIDIEKLSEGDILTISK